MINCLLMESRMKPSRKRKRISTDNDVSKNESTPKRTKAEVAYSTKKGDIRLATENSSGLIANVREIKIILDKSIVGKYFRAKQTLREILSPTDTMSPRPSNDDKSKKQTSLLNYFQVHNDSLDCLFPDNIENSVDSAIIKDPSDVDQNNDVPFDVNTPRIVYYTGSDQSNCFFNDGNWMVMPVNGQFTPEEFIYNNYDFVSVMGVPIKTEPPDEESIVIEDLDEMNSVDEHTTMSDYHTMSDVTSIDGIATTSTPMIKTSTFGEKIIKSETRQRMAKFDKDGFPTCLKCDRSFKILGSFKQHMLLCGLEFMFECLYCTYASKFSHAMKKHIIRMHKAEVKGEGLEEIVKKIRDKRMDNKYMSLLSKEAEYDSEDEKAFIQSLENFKVNHSKLKVDLFCPQCEMTFKRVQRLSIKACVDCAVTLEFRCQICKEIFSQYYKVYRHAINCSNHKPNPMEKYSFACAHCSFKSYHKLSLRRHIYQHHMKHDNTMYYRCQHCSFKSLYEHNFKRHVRTLHGANQTIDIDK